MLHNLKFLHTFLRKSDLQSLIDKIKAVFHALLHVANDHYNTLCYEEKRWNFESQR